MWPVLVAVGLGAVAVYEEWPKVKGFVSGFSKPPVVDGYHAPPGPPEMPPSWSYQGPMVPAAKPVVAAGALPPAPIQVKLAAGIAHATPKKGSTLVFTLPVGAAWDAGDPALVPTSIGGDLANQTASSVSLVGVDGAGTIQFNWTAGGKKAQALFDISVSA